MTIQIITSSTTLSQRLLNSFNSGLADAGRSGYPLEPVKYVDGKYDDGDGLPGKRQELYDAMKTADSNNNIEVIIAAGGLVSAHAANKELINTSFLILVGHAPVFDLNAPKYCGGVNLDMVRQNKDRHDYLLTHYNVAQNRVALIWNSNSKMGKVEKRFWIRNNWPACEVATNSEDAITTAFGMAKTVADAVVVSGDPYFAGHMNVVVKAANDQTLKACYPFSGYSYATPPPTAKANMVYGPDLDLAYRVLGRKAATVLNSLKAPPHTGLDPCPTVGPIFLGE